MQIPLFKGKISVMVDLFPFTDVDWPHESYHVPMNGIRSPRHQ